MIAQVAKAIAAAATAAATALGAAAADNGITGAELAVALLGGLAAGAAVWATPNAEPGGGRHAGG